MRESIPEDLRHKYVTDFRNVLARFPRYQFVSGGGDKGFTALKKLVANVRNDIVRGGARIFSPYTCQQQLSEMEMIRKADAGTSGLKDPLARLGGGGGSKSKPCFAWNKGACARKDRPFVHVCQKCKDPGHRVNVCPRKAKK